VTAPLVFFIKKNNTRTIWNDLERSGTIWNDMELERSGTFLNVRRTTRQESYERPLLYGVQEKNNKGLKNLKIFYAILHPI
jgi:hypothetical protein